MASPLTEQLQVLESKLSTIKDHDVRQAVEAQIALITKKINAKGERKTTLGDGVIAKIGEHVWNVLRQPRIETGYGTGQETFHNGMLACVRITAISADGKELTPQGRFGSSEISKNYFSTKEAAVESAFKYAKLRVERAEKDVAQAKKSLEAAFEIATTLELEGLACFDEIGVTE